MNFPVDRTTQKSARSFCLPLFILIEGFSFGRSEAYYDELNRFAERPFFQPHLLISHLIEYST